MIDVLALLIDRASDETKTTILISRALGITNAFKNHEDILNCTNRGKELMILKQIIEKL